ATRSIDPSPRTAPASCFVMALLAPAIVGGSGARQHSSTGSHHYSLDDFQPRQRGFLVNAGRWGWAFSFHGGVVEVRADDRLNCLPILYEIKTFVEHDHGPKCHGVTRLRPVGANAAYRNPRCLQR